jgi:hypothetical protein
MATENSLLRRAYRQAGRQGFVLRRSRRMLSEHNRGGLMLIDASTNIPQVGWDFDATVGEILDYLTLDNK